MSEVNDEYIVGIDLGTTSSCVAIWRNNNLEIIPDELGDKIIPSVIAYTNVSRYIGNDAKNQRDLNPSNVFYEIKRLIGRKYDDSLIKTEKEFISYNITHDDKNNILLAPELKDKKTLTPEEIQASILCKLKNMSSEYLKSKVTKAVVTIPAYFNDGQRQATKDACTIAGLDCIRMINEPTAASLSYGLLNKSLKTESKTNYIIVYDFGGGTLDVSLLNIKNGLFEVIASSGNTRLGGSDFDTRLMSFCISKFKKINNITEIDKLPSISLQRLRSGCEQAKKLLSTCMKTHIAVKEFYDNKDLFIQMTRTDFEKICADLFILSLKPIDDILTRCELNTNNINDIILVGGMTRIPKVRDLIKMRFNKEPNCSINPEEAIAAGAAIQAYMITHQTDPFSDNITLLDSTALSLGVETMGGIMDIVIPRNSTIPTDSSKLYSTDQDNTDTVTIKVFEGERTLTKDNFLVGEFDLTGIELVPRGIPEIEVTFNIDENGIITVTAENRKNNNSSSIIVTSNKNRLSHDEIERLVEESKEQELRDLLDKRRKLIHYQIDDFCSNILFNLQKKKSNLVEDEVHISEEDKNNIKSEITKVLEWLKEKKYYERDDDELENKLNFLKKKYGVLILKCKVNEKFEAMNNLNENTATDVYKDEDDDERTVQTVFTNIEEEEIGVKGMDDPEKLEIKELRKNISDLCYSINELINSNSTKLSDEHKNELKDYVDDTLLWLYVHNKIQKPEYKMKIDEINENCNKIMSHYQSEGKEVFSNEINPKNKRDELENSCIVLKLLIEDKQLFIDDIKKKTIYDEISKILDWIYGSDIELEKETNKETFYNQCNDKLTNLNILCNEINKELFVRGDIDKFTEVNKIYNDKESGNIIMAGYNDEHHEETDMKTDLLTIMREQQKQVISNMLNQMDKID